MSFQTIETLDISFHQLSTLLRLRSCSRLFEVSALFKFAAMAAERAILCKKYVFPLSFLLRQLLAASLFSDAFFCCFRPEGIPFVRDGIALISVASRLASLSFFASIVLLMYYILLFASVLICLPVRMDCIDSKQYRQRRLQSS